MHKAKLIGQRRGGRTDLPLASHVILLYISFPVGRLTINFLGRPPHNQPHDRALNLSSSNTLVTLQSHIICTIEAGFTQGGMV